MSFNQQDVWYPTPDAITGSNISVLIRRMGLPDYDAFLQKSVDRPDLYWAETLKHMGIAFDPSATTFVDNTMGKPWARFFPNAGFNVAEACLRAPPGPGGSDRPAILGEDEQGRRISLSYRELNARTRAFAAGLSELGIAPGDRVGLFFASSPDAVVSLLAICYLGAIVVPLYSGFGAEAIARRLTDSGAKLLIAADGFQRKGRYVSLGATAIEAVASIEGCELVIAYDDDTARPTAKHSRWQDVATVAKDMVAAKTFADDPCMIIYTSGTSGKPKGAVHRHAGFPLRVAQDTAFLFDFRQNDRFFWPSDMGWMVGPYSTFASLLLKGALVMYSGSPDWPDIGRLRAVAIGNGVTHFGTTPTAIRAMAAAEDKVLTSPAPALRVLMTGGEVIDDEAHNWLYHRFGDGKLPIINYTGGTECSGAILSNVVLRPIVPGRFNSTAPGVAAGVVDDEGKQRKGVPGELAIAQAFNGMTAGFWNDAERYLETYWSRVPGIWVHGDLALEEEDGQYRLLGRSDDVMKVSGRRIGPSEIEGCVVDGHLVIDAVAFGVPDQKTGEAMIVFAVPGPDATATAAAMIESAVSQAIRQKMGASFRAQAIVTMPELIKTRNGKLVRRLARQAWLGEPPGDLSALENPAVFDRVASLCAAFRQAGTQFFADQSAVTQVTRTKQ
jgi:acetyl-CoA synthetase